MDFTYCISSEAKHVCLAANEQKKVEKIVYLSHHTLSLSGYFYIDENNIF